MRSICDEFNLIECLHTFFSEKQKIYQNILPPLRLLSEKDKIKFFNQLKEIGFYPEQKAA